MILKRPFLAHRQGTNIRCGEGVWRTRLSWLKASISETGLKARCTAITTAFGPLPKQPRTRRKLADGSMKSYKYTRSERYLHSKCL